MKVEDRFTRGFTAGLISSAPAFLFNQGAFYVRFSSLRWTDFMGIFIYGKKPVLFLEHLFAVIVVLLFLGLLGGIFAYLILKISSDSHLLKGWIFGLIVWFGTFSITSLANRPEISTVSVNTAFSNFLGASIWGAAMAHVLQWLDKG